MCLSQKPPTEHCCVFQIRKDFVLLKALSQRPECPSWGYWCYDFSWFTVLSRNGMWTSRVQELPWGTWGPPPSWEGVHFGESRGEERSAWLQPSPRHEGMGIRESLPRERGCTETPEPAKEKESRCPKTNTLLAQTSIPWGSTELHPEEVQSESGLPYQRQQLGNVSGCGLVEDLLPYFKKCWKFPVSYLNFASKKNIFSLIYNSSFLFQQWGLGTNSLLICIDN